jgi:Protein of unknown function (DUF402)
VTDIALRELWRGRVWRASPCRVVQERDGLLVLWQPPNTPVWRPFADARELRVPGDADWRLEPRPLETEGLGLLRLGDRHSLWLMWRDASFSGWYVNFERGHVRTSVSIDMIDEKLDLVVAPDGTWHWKDEDELAEAGRTGYVDEAEVRAEADRVLHNPPWPTGWEDWRPDPAWPAPQLPEGWDVV